MRSAQPAGTIGTLTVVALAWVLMSGLARGQGYETLELLNPLITPRDVAADPSGNVYVLGSDSGNVFQIRPSGVVREIFDLAEEGLAGQVGGLHSIAVDSAGFVYVTASGTDNALRIFPRPLAEIISGTGDGSGSILRTPTGIATGIAARDVYVVGSGSATVFKITPLGTASAILDRRGNGVRSCIRPVDVAVDRADNVYVACEESHNVFQITPSGTIREVLTNKASFRPPVDRPRILATDAAGSLYVASSASVLRISSSMRDAEIIHRERGFPVGRVTGLAVDPAANVYVSSSGNDRVYRITPNGTPYEIANSRGDGTHPLDLPNALAVDSSGNLYVSGGRSDNVFRVAPNGTVAQILDKSGDHSWLHLRWPLRRLPLGRH